MYKRQLPEDGAAPLAPEPAATAADTVEADVAVTAAAAANAAADVAPEAARRDDAASPKHADAALADETARCSLGETLPPPPPAPHEAMRRARPCQRPPIYSHTRRNIRWVFCN